jgi:hypothetical protein
MRQHAVTWSIYATLRLFCRGRNLQRHTQRPRYSSAGFRVGRGHQGVAAGARLVQPFKSMPRCPPGREMGLPTALGASLYA